MERREIKEVWYNNKHIVLNKELVLYSDGSYERNGIRRYGNSNGNYLKMSLYDIEGKEHKVFMHTLILCVFGSDRPSEEYEVDHIDRNKHNNDIYNLRWVTRKLNVANKNDMKEFNGSLFIKLFNEADNRFNLSYDVIHHRVYNLGWDFEKAVSTPLIKRNEITEGRVTGWEKRKTDLHKWFDKQENKYKISYKTFYHRVKYYGMSKEEALSRDIRQQGRVKSR